MSLVWRGAVLGAGLALSTALLFALLTSALVVLPRMLGSPSFDLPASIRLVGGLSLFALQMGLVPALLVGAAAGALLGALVARVGHRLTPATAFLLGVAAGGLAAILLLVSVRVLFLFDAFVALLVLICMAAGGWTALALLLKGRDLRIIRPTG